MTTLLRRFGEWWSRTTGSPAPSPPQPHRPLPSNGSPSLARTVVEREGELRLESALYHYKAYVREVYDGDTITVDLDLGLRIWQQGERIRLWKIDTPELTGAERAAGLVVRDYVRELILDKMVLVRTILDKRGIDQTGKYGRLLGEVLLPDGAGNLININELLLAEGKARPMGSDGSHSVAAGTRGADGESLPAQIRCPYCGENRRTEPATRTVKACPNCLDPAFTLWPPTTTLWDER